MLIKCRIEYIDDKTQIETYIKTNHEYKNDEEDEKNILLWVKFGRSY